MNGRVSKVHEFFASRSRDQWLVMGLYHLCLVMLLLLGMYSTAVGGFIMVWSVVALCYAMKW